MSNLAKIIELLIQLDAERAYEEAAFATIRKEGAE